MKINKEAFDRMVEEHRAREKKAEGIVQKIWASGNLFDEDGYPTSRALMAIKIWPYSLRSSFMPFLQDLWHMKYWCWDDRIEPHSFIEADKVHRFYLSTGGWSGNESIIKAFQENTDLWEHMWYESRRGGHYVFELDFDDE